MIAEPLTEEELFKLRASLDLRSGYLTSADRLSARLLATLYARSAIGVSREVLRVWWEVHHEIDGSGSSKIPTFVSFDRIALALEHARARRSGNCDVKVVRVTRARKAVSTEPLTEPLTEKELSKLRASALYGGRADTPERWVIRLAIVRPTDVMRYFADARGSRKTPTRSKAAVFASYEDAIRALEKSVDVDAPFLYRPFRLRPRARRKDSDKRLREQRDSLIAQLNAATAARREVQADLSVMRESYTKVFREPAGIAMLLNCPRCHAQHEDVGEWLTRPHKTHQCQRCAHEWRPANVPTIGVLALGAGHPTPTTKDRT